MAIIEELGLEVKIFIGGKAVKEFPDPKPDLQGLVVGPDTKTSHCYIECQENVEFEIRSKVRSGNNPAARWAQEKKGFVLFDPSFNGGPYLPGSIVLAPGESTNDCGIVDFDDGTVRKFRFSKVSTVEVTDERSVAKDMETAKNFGLLRIGVWRVREKREESSGEESSGEGSSGAKHDTSGLSEGCLTLAEVDLKGKAISLGATLSCFAEKHEHNQGSFVDYFDSEDRPFAVFGFKYRTREDLQKAMIIPRPPLPSPEPVVAEQRQEPANSSHPRADYSQLVADRVQDLSYEEALRLARERLDFLQLEEFFKLFGQDFKEIPVGNVLRLAGERLTKLPFRTVLQLAAERLEDAPDKDKRSVIIKSESQEGQRSERSSETPARIKHRREEELRSERASKHRQCGGRRDAINLIEDD